MPSEMDTLKRTSLFAPDGSTPKKVRINLIEGDVMSEHTAETTSSNPDPLHVIEGLQVHDLSLSLSLSRYIYYI